MKVPKRGFPSRVVVGDEEEERVVEEALRCGRGEDGWSRAPGEGAVGVFELRRDGVGACDDGQGDGEEEGALGALTPSRRRFAQASFCSAVKMPRDARRA